MSIMNLIKSFKYNKVIFQIYIYIYNKVNVTEKPSEDTSLTKVEPMMDQKNLDSGGKNNNKHNKKFHSNNSINTSKNILIQKR